MTDNERAMYTGLCICRNTEVAQRWARSQVFILIHSAGLSFIFANTQSTSLLYFWSSLGGLALMIFWYFTNRRTTQLIVYWQSRLAEFEQSKTNPIEINVFTGKDWDRWANPWFPFHVILNILIAFFAILWLYALAKSFFL